MNIFKTAKEKGYKHYTENTIEDLDKLPVDNIERRIEMYLLVDWLLKEHDIFVGFDVYNKDGSIIINLKDGTGMLISSIMTNYNVNEMNLVYDKALEEAFKLI